MSSVTPAEYKIIVFNGERERAGGERGEGDKEKEKTGHERGWGGGYLKHHQRFWRLGDKKRTTVLTKTVWPYFYLFIYFHYPPTHEQTPSKPTLSLFNLNHNLKISLQTP